MNYHSCGVTTKSGNWAPTAYWYA